MGFGLTVGFVAGVWYGARLESARAASLPKTDAEPLLEPVYRTPEWMKERLGVIEKETRGKQDIDFPKSYNDSKAMGLDG